MLTRIGLIGDHDPRVLAHRAIPPSLARAGAALRVEVEHDWLATESIAPDDTGLLERYDALWCVPASPYRSTEGALAAIRYAREQGVPFLGTCGGFQHALLEFARNVAGMAGAAHAELEPEAHEPLIGPLACALVERRGGIFLQPGSRAHVLCDRSELDEGYHCSYGLNAVHEAALARAGLVFSGRDGNGEVRVFELPSHPFYLGTLFQPERAGLNGEAHPLVRGLVAAAARAS
jgi:CTP synthase (UTP-ammonia lyase)